MQHACGMQCVCLQILLYLLWWKAAGQWSQTCCISPWDKGAQPKINWCFTSFLKFSKSCSQMPKTHITATKERP